MSKTQDLQNTVLAGDQAQALMRLLASWSNTTTIVIHLGSVFEFKGPFPAGSEGSGYYNLAGPLPGFHGHIGLERIDHIRFQDKPHRGRESYAFVFCTAQDETIFKVFLGRDAQGQLLADQVAAFKQIQAQGAVAVQ